MIYFMVKEASNGWVIEMGGDKYGTAIAQTFAEIQQVMMNLYKTLEHPPESER